MNNKRFIQFDGAANFRDIGGIKTQDGRTMKSGILFRSDELSQLTNKDLEKLEHLNLKLICDLRTPDERKSKPDKIPHNGNVRVVNVPIYHQDQNVTRLQFFWFLTFKSRGFDFENFIKDHYHRIAFERTTHINEIITLISEKRNLPALIHCTAGKDRTGYISALIQLLVGIPRKTVLDDYLATNRFIEPRMKKIIRYLRWTSLFQISTDRMKPILEARREYIDEVLNDILKQFGTIEGYLSKACDINQCHIKNLQKLLLE